jgi:hypothetical protein
MDGWMMKDDLMDGWIDGYIYEWMDVELLDEYIDGRKDGWLD